MFALRILADSMVTLPYGLGGTFDSLFEGMDEVSMDIYDTLTVLVYVLAFAGLLLTAYKMQMGGDYAQLGGQLFSTAVVAVVLNFLPDWVNSAQSVMGFTFADSIDVDMGKIATDFVAEVATWMAGEVIYQSTIGVVGIMFLGIWGMILVLAGLILICVAAVIAIWVWVAVLLAYIIQVLSLQLGVGFSPIFLGMFLFPTTKETSVKYFTGLVAILCWPLGWAAGFKVVKMLLDQWHKVMIECAPLTALDFVTGGIVDGFIYIIIGIFFWTVIKKAPPLMAKAITTGSQIGAGLVSAGVGAAFSTVSTTISSTTAAAGAAASAAGTVAGAAIGGAATGGAGAAAGAGIGGAIGGAAGSAISGAGAAAAGGVKSAGDGLSGMSEGV